MATLTLHDLPDDVMSRLEKRAQAHGRDLNSEVVDCLKRQTAGLPDAATWLQEVEELRFQLKGAPIPVDELVAATDRESH